MSREPPRRAPISPRALAALLPPADDAAYAATDARALSYPLGSGQAEEIALLSGLRPMIRQLLHARDLEAARRRFESRGLVVGTAPIAYGPTRDGWVHTAEPARLTSEERRVPFFVGRDRAAVEEAIAAESDVSPDGHRLLGQRLGYPRCCVEHFVSVPRPRRNDDVLRAALAASTAFDPLLNVFDLGVFHWISWMPCTFDCALSRRYAEAVAAIVRRTHPAFVASIERSLSSHRLALLADVQLSMRGQVDGSTLTIEDVWPTARDRNARATLPIDAREATARAYRLLRGKRRLDIRPDALVVDGAEVPLPAPPLFAPFGEPTHR